jgi:hypothetical protein
LIEEEPVLTTRTRLIRYPPRRLPGPGWR